MYPSLRNFHLAAALFSLPFLLAFAVSAVDFAHRKWLPHPAKTTAESLKLKPGITDARVLARQWRGELASVETPPGALQFRVMTPLGRGYDVTYSIATGDATVQTATIGFLTTLSWLHISRGIWAYVAGLVSLGLFILGITGLYLWFQNHSERKTGIALLLAGAVLTIGLIVSMRLG